MSWECPLVDISSPRALFRQALSGPPPPDCVLFRTGLTNLLCQTVGHKHLPRMALVISNFESPSFRKVIPSFKGASGAGSLLLNTKASQEAACSRAPAAIAPGQEPELQGAGVSGNAGKGSYPAATDATEGHAEQVDGPGSSGNTGIGSHLESADFNDESGRSCGGTPHCTVQNQVFCRTRRPRRTVRYRKRPCGVRELILAPGPHAAVAAA